MKTGRDIAIATLLSTEQWGVATAALVVQGLYHDAEISPEYLPGWYSYLKIN